MKHTQLKNILFLDIETIAQKSSFDELSSSTQKHWERKCNSFKNSESKDASELYERAGIYAEFGQIVAIAIGYLSPIQDNYDLRVKTIANSNERTLLSEFSNLIGNFSSKDLVLCAHNGKEFDFPYIARRLLINELPLPDCLQLAGKKPWEINHIDTLELWKFGDYKHFTSLDLLAHIFKIRTSKSDIDGSMVNQVYYETNDLQRIADYCAEDIRVLAEVYLKMTAQNDIKIKKVSYINDKSKSI